MLNKVELMLLCAIACCFSISFVDVVPFREELLELSGCTGQEFWRSYSKNKSKLAGCMVGSVLWRSCSCKVYLRWDYKTQNSRHLIFLGNGKWHWIFFTQDKIVAARPAVANELTCKIVERSNNVIDGNLITGKGIGTVVDFALGIIRKFFGHGRAKSVANGIVFEYPKSWSTKELLKLRKAQHIYGCNQRSGYLWSW